MFTYIFFFFAFLFFFEKGFFFLLLELVRKTFWYTCAHSGHLDDEMMGRWEHLLCNRLVTWRALIRPRQSSASGLLQLQRNLVILAWVVILSNGSYWVSIESAIRTERKIKRAVGQLEILKEGIFGVIRIRCILRTAMRLNAYHFQYKSLSETRQNLW